MSIVDVDVESARKNSHHTLNLCLELWSPANAATSSDLYESTATTGNKSTETDFANAAVTTWTNIESI